MNLSKYLPFQYFSVIWRRVALFFVTLFAVLSLQHFIAEPSLSTPSSASNAIAPVTDIDIAVNNADKNGTLVAQNAPSDRINIRDYDRLTPKQKALFNQIIFFAGIFGIISYIYISFCMMKIADKLGISNSWLAWIPILQVWIIVRSAGKPGWWIILLLIPLVNIVISFIILFATPANLGKSPLLGLLIFIPLLGMYLYYGLLAFT